MLNDIINYGVRIVIILLGILLAGGVLTPGKNDPMIRIVGIIAILFGLYRIVMYSRNKRKYKNLSKATKVSQNDDKTDKFYYDDFDDNSIVDNDSTDTRDDK